MAITTYTQTQAGINEHFAQTMQEAFDKDNSFLKALTGDASLSMKGEVNYKYGLGNIPSGGSGNGNVTRVTSGITTDLTPNPVTAQRYYYPVLEEALPFEMSNTLMRRTDIENVLMSFLSQVPEVCIDTVNRAVLSHVKGIARSEEDENAGETVMTDVSLATRTATSVISRDNILKAQAELGERGGAFRYIAMHSNSYWGLRQVEDTDFFKTSDPQFLGGGASGFTGEKYLGMNIIVDDSLTYDTKTIATDLVVMFADNAFMVNRSAPKFLVNPYDIFAAGSGTQQVNAVWMHNHHIDGYSWATNSTTAATVDPTDTQLGTKGNSTRIIDKQNLKFAFLRVNKSDL